MVIEGRDGLMLEVHALDHQYQMQARYLAGDNIVDVRIEPFGRTTASYVRTESIHVDIDEAGYPVAIEITGPSSLAWQRKDPLRVPRAERGRVRFIAREQEVGPERAFETDHKGRILHVAISDAVPARHVMLADGLVLGVSRHDELVDLWISQFLTSFPVATAERPA